MISRLKLILENKNASITYKKEGEDFEVYGSLLHLTNLLHNLVDNALKYCSANPSIDIGLRQLDSRILITVKDNGVGIPKEFHNKIFEKFFRIPSGDVHNSKGYGLGLSYASNVVKNHNGTIEVLSEINHGSEFRITLPRGKEFKIVLP
jgi:two-component system phosphate regulon sensor histidine kinase PhoR